MRERGEMFLVNSTAVPRGSFLLLVTDKDIKTGDIISQEGTQVIFASVDASEADKLFALGISRRENLLGRNTLLFIDKNTEVKF